MGPNQVVPKMTKICEMNRFSPNQSQKNIIITLDGRIAPTDTCLKVILFTLSDSLRRNFQLFTDKSVPKLITLPERSISLSSKSQSQDIEASLNASDG